MHGKPGSKNPTLPADCSAFPSFSSAFAVAVCCLGLSAFLTQLALMRELLSAFSGNELVFGIVLGNWMLLTGIGSTLGKTASRLRSPIAVFVAAEDPHRLAAHWPTCSCSAGCGTWSSSAARKWE